MGNHDAKNIGYRYFEDLFGSRSNSRTIPYAGGEAKVVALDSTKPDLDEGEVGREYYAWIDSEFRDWDKGPKILLIHHHILAVPGTGRDSNILRDAGDVMALLREVGVDLVLSGHRHVPYFWSISGCSNRPLRHGGQRAHPGDGWTFVQPDRAGPGGS